MKKEILTLLLIILSISIYAQTKIDSVFSINLPEGFQKEGRIEEGESDGYSARVKLDVFTYDNSSKDFFLLLTTTVLDENNKIIENNPESISELFKKYSTYSKDFKVSLYKKGCVFTDSSEINIDGFLGQKLIFKDTITNKVNAEANILEINGKMYLAIYSEISEFNEERKNIFLNSIKIATPNIQRQVVENSFNLKTDLYKLVFYLLISIIFFYFANILKKSR